MIWGTRPEQVKLYPVWLELSNYGIVGEDMVTIFTGQHDTLVDHEHLAIPVSVNLGVMREGQTMQELLGRCISELTKHDLSSFDVIIVQGDTSSALAGALAGFYSGIYSGIPVAHVEAGLSTHYKFSPYPEEMHRRMIRELSTIHFAPTMLAESNLLWAGVAKEDIYMVGNTVIDALQYIMYRAGISYPTKGNSGDVIITIHRRENERKLDSICAGLSKVANSHLGFKFKFVTHPRIAEKVSNMITSDNIACLPAMDYVSFVKELAHATFAITDSGGVQEEASLLGVPVFVVRENTERPESITAGVSRIVGTSSESIVTKITEGIRGGFTRQRKSLEIYGDGMAGKRIAQVLVKELG